MTTNLPSGYTMRAPTQEDAQAVADLIIACDMFETGASDFTLGQMMDDWGHMDLATSSRVVVAPDGRIVGSEDILLRSADAPYDIDGYVHPEHMGLGIGSCLVRDVEARIVDYEAQTASGHPVTIRVTINDGNPAAHTLFRDGGFAPVRYFYRMKRQLDEAPAAPEWPKGIAVRAFVPGQDERALYAAVEEAFEDHWGHHPTPFEQWVNTRLQAEGFAPELCLLAVDGDEIAGTALCYDRGDDGGWVKNLGVRRPWRRAGLGMALLREAMGLFYRRGRRWVGLGVDAASPTGATRLYERAGMVITDRAATYEKVVNILS